MTFSVVTYNLIDKEDFFNFCREASTEVSQPAAKNMWNINWKDKPETLPYLLEVNKRFNEPNGEFFILKSNDKIIGCSGVYTSQFDSQIGIAGVRTWIHKDYRNSGIKREYILPEQKQWCKDNGHKLVALTFNDYNKNIIQIFKRKRLGEVTDRITSREPHHLFYNGLEEVKFPVIIQHTKQWVIYEKLTNWDYNWELIAA
jgi:hypothetical protein